MKKEIKNVCSSSIKKVGKIDNLTLSKKSKPGDGAFNCGVKGGGKI